MTDILRRPAETTYAEIAADAFPVPEQFHRVYAQKSPWWIGDGKGALGRYVEHLYERR